MNATEQQYNDILSSLEHDGNLRKLPDTFTDGRWITKNGIKAVNLSSNDYLGLSHDVALLETFFCTLPHDSRVLSACSSRLLTGSYPAHHSVESKLRRLYNREGALCFSSGYHLNTGILPAIADKRTLIIADKLVHASIIDGIRLASSDAIRFRHQDLNQLESILNSRHRNYERIIIVTESIFSMDGDVTNLKQLVEFKRQYPNVMLYIDEAHAIGTRGTQGLGIAEEQNCIQEVDLLCGTFGKALASMGAFVVCNKVIQDLLINKARTFIFTTALPPLQMAWSHFILENLGTFCKRRQWLIKSSQQIKDAILEKGISCKSGSHIIPLLVGDNHKTNALAEEMQRHGFYVMPIRPPTVPQGSARLRFSLSASISQEEVEKLIQAIKQIKL